MFLVAYTARTRRRYVAGYEASDGAEGMDVSEIWNRVPAGKKAARVKGEAGIQDGFGKHTAYSAITPFATFLSFSTYRI